jgi:hypothetical protein
MMNTIGANFSRFVPRALVLKIGRKIVDKA